MIRKGRAALLALALAAGSATQAHAVSWAGNGSYCGGNTFSTCFTVNMTWTTVAGTTTVVLQLTKVSGPDTKWFSVGLDNLPLSAAGGFVDGSSTDASYDPPPPNDFGGGPFIDPTVSAICNGGCNPPLTTQSWTFSLTGVSDAQLQLAGAGIHAGGALINSTNCSTKVVVRSSGGVYSANQPPANNPCLTGGDPNTSVPEPATMGLLALGLVGLGGAGLIRRRRSV